MACCGGTCKASTAHFQPPKVEPCNKGAARKEIPEEAQRHRCMDLKGDPCKPAHNEYICHSIGEKRDNFLKEIKRVVDKMETEPCPTRQIVESEHGSGCQLDRQPILKYPGYADIESSKFKNQNQFIPLITNVPLKETRPTSEMKKHRHEQSYEVTYIPIAEAALCKPWAVPRKKSFELRGGIIYKGCQCPKHNGLQDRCDRTECNGKPKCLTQPEPSCAPSQGFMGPPNQRGVGDMAQEAMDKRQKPPLSSIYCCCRNPTKSKMIDGIEYPDCNHAPGRGFLECYNCHGNC